MKSNKYHFTNLTANEFGEVLEQNYENEQYILKNVDN